ncbi:MAG: SpvB/TcaC N-terminal domain-containing protein [Myxococcales bacterium]
MRSIGKVASILALVGWASWARAETGVSDERVSLPDGPGSIGGAGDNVLVAPNMGSMSYSVPIEVPEGFAGATPSLSLAYSSMLGSSEVGIGWEMRVPNIERFTLRGVPRYNSDDVFAADGFEELVQVVSADGSYTYRARFEGGFVRYTWHADKAGAAGYWQAEYPDGSQAFFGADSKGNADPNARVATPDGGVFRYLIVEQVDRLGHSVRYQYQRYGNYPLLDQVSYLFTNGEPHYRVSFAYEQRTDAISDGTPGFDLRLTVRMSGVTVFSGDVPMRRYELAYDTTPEGTSRLSQVLQLGLEDELFPIRFAFSYSSALNLGCANCSKPVMVDMGTLSAGDSGGVDMQNGRSTMIDINGDSLPDILDTGVSGSHRFFVNTMDANGVQRFAAPLASARTMGGGMFQLTSPGVQAADVNGDGFTDLVNAVQGAVLCNDGSGDWSASSACAGSVALGSLEADPNGGAADHDPLSVRFMDYDGDRRIDLLRTLSKDSATVLHNTSEGFKPETIDGLGAVFDASNLQLADLNGDGLLDPAEVLNSGVVKYKLNLGRGKWTPKSTDEWIEAPLQGTEGLSSGALDEAELQDLNGDGLDDVVVVLGNGVAFALNRAGAFLPFQSITSQVVEGTLPTRDASTTVLFADMNGSGTTDVVWISSQGDVQYLELFALRPNLLTQVDNGIGGIQLVEYGTTAVELARDKASGAGWRHRLPQAMNVVTATESYAQFTAEVVSRTELSYHHGFYDGVEKRYRGFEVVEQHELAEEVLDSQEAGLTVSEFDVGASDPYRNGKLLRQQVFGGSDTARHVVQQQTLEYADCPLADVPAAGLRLAVRNVCEVASKTVLQEGRPDAEWATLLQTQAYDGYGNVTLSVNHGVVGMGPNGADACAPCIAPQGVNSGACGAECLGDEAYAATEYVAPGESTANAWMLANPSRVRSYGREGGPFRETLVYYDGPAFVGQARGTLTQGLVSRVCERISTDAMDECQGPGWALSQRASYDADGNVTESLDPLGAPENELGHRRRLEYDEYQLHVVAEEVLLSNAEGPYRLRREVKHDSVFAVPVSVTRWMLVGSPQSSDPAPTLLAYDAFGRRVAIAMPGDSLDAPTQSYEYALASPVSQVITRLRSESGKPADIEQRQCIDGFGRAVQTRTRLDTNSYQVSGANEVNRRGVAVRAYEPYQSASSACERVPVDVRYHALRYDALGRGLTVTMPDEVLYGEPSVARTEYRPLVTLAFDPEDTDPNSYAFDTPELTHVDALGRKILAERYLTSGGGQIGSVRFLYDDFGNMSGYVDGMGNTNRRYSDLLGRLVHIDDPSAGTLDFVFDAAGNQLARTDARGETTAMAYDGANRLIATYNPKDDAATRVERRYDYIAGCSECVNGEGKAVTVHYPLGSYGDGLDEAGFDLRDRPVFTARTLEKHRFVIKTQFDNANRVTSTEYPDGTVVAQRYDAASRLVGIDGILDSLAYTSTGQLQSVMYANGVHTEIDYDVLRRMSSLQTVGPREAGVLQGFAYQRDRVGNLKSIKDISTPREGAIDWNASFSRDAWYRPLAVTLGSPESESHEELKMSYDLVDKVLSKTSSAGNRSAAHLGGVQYGGQRPLAATQAGDVQYEYDAAGRVVGKAVVDAP